MTTDGELTGGVAPPAPPLRAIGILLPLIPEEMRVNSSELRGSRQTKRREKHHKLWFPTILNEK